MMVALVFAASPVDVRSATNCPATEDVVERLIPLLPTAATGLADGQDVAQIEVGEVQAGGVMELHLRLVRADSSEIGDRRLLMQGTCQDMAEAVATVIAAWETKPLPEAAAAGRPGAPCQRGPRPPAGAAFQACSASAPAVASSCRSRGGRCAGRRDCR